MESSGNGVTFSENDIKLCQSVIGLLNKASFNLSAAQAIEAAQALVWIQRDLIKIMNDNVMELKRVITPPAPLPEEKPVKSSKAK